MGPSRENVGLEGSSHFRTSSALPPMSTRYTKILGTVPADWHALELGMQAGSSKRKSGSRRRRQSHSNGGGSSTVPQFQHAALSERGRLPQGATKSKSSRTRKQSAHH